MSERVTVYLVQSVGWWYNDEFSVGPEVTEPAVMLDARDGEACEAVEAFRTPEAAERARLSRDRAARGLQSPFEYGGYDGGLATFSDLPPATVERRFRASGIVPPENFATASGAEWKDWWSQNVGRWRPSQRQVIWDAMTRVIFYTVVPMEIELAREG